jgi:hypothetical protein
MTLSRALSGMSNELFLLWFYVCTAPQNSINHASEKRLLSPYENLFYHRSMPTLLSNGFSCALSYARRHTPASMHHRSRKLLLLFNTELFPIQVIIK